MVRRQFFFTVEPEELYQKTVAEHLATQLLNQLSRGKPCSASCQQVVYEHYFGAFMDGVSVHFKRV